MCHFKQDLLFWTKILELSIISGQGKYIKDCYRVRSVRQIGSVTTPRTAGVAAAVQGNLAGGQTNWSRIPFQLFYGEHKRWVRFYPYKTFSCVKTFSLICSRLSPL